MPRPSPEATVPAPKVAAVKRRKARRPATLRVFGPVVSDASETGPTARRATGAAIRTGALWRFTPSD